MKKIVTLLIFLMIIGGGLVTDTFAQTAIPTISVTPTPSPTETATPTITPTPTATPDDQISELTIHKMAVKFIGDEDESMVKGKFIVDQNDLGVDFVSDDLTFAIDDFEIIIPAGSFVLNDGVTVAFGSAQGFPSIVLAKDEDDGNKGKGKNKGKNKDKDDDDESDDDDDDEESNDDDESEMENEDVESNRRADTTIIWVFDGDVDGSHVNAHLEELSIDEYTFSIKLKTLKGELAGTKNPSTVVLKLGENVWETTVPFNELRFESDDNQIGEDMDSDSDGVNDSEDDCPDSDLSENIVIDGCDTDVSNDMVRNGCSISDLINKCADLADNHGQFVRCVSQLTNTLRRERIITGNDKGDIQSCASGSSLP